MKIACISTSTIPSSTANSMQAMKACQALAQTGAEVCLWVPGRETRPWEELAAHYGLSTPFEVRRIPAIPALKRYDFALRAQRLALAWKPDLIYTWLAQSAVLAEIAGLPVVYEQHDRATGKLGPWLLRRFLHHQGKKRLLVITDALRRLDERLFGYAFRPGEVVVAPNGADLERYAGLPGAPEARRRLALPERLTAVYTGHFYAGRGIDLLFELARRLPEIGFLWVGGRPEDVAAWQAKLDAAGMRNVLLTGFVENRRLPLYQAAGDVLLMPYERAIAGSSGGNSAEICSPMKMFEYMAAGRAILASDLPVLHEVLNPGNAVFAPPEDVAAWETALAVLCADPARRAGLAAQARADAANYTWLSRAQRALEGMIDT